MKMVLIQEVIKSVIDYNEFHHNDQEYAREIWLLLYGRNGMNYADLLRLKWKNIKGKYILFNRMNTKNNQKDNIREIVVPKTTGVKELPDKAGNNKSTFILGRLPDIYDEETLGYINFQK